MKPVKAVDAAFLQLETAATPMHVGAVFVLDPPSRQAGRTFFRRLKLLIAARLDRSEVFTRHVAALPFNAANPIWLAGRADLDYHVRRTVLPAPGSQHQLEECVADLHTPLMDRERPLWELHVIEGLEGGRLALYVKTHHAGLDGASAQLFLRSFVDTAARPARRSTRPPRLPQVEHVTTTDLLLAGLRHQVAELGRLPRLIGGLAGQLPDTFRGARDALLTRAPGGPSSAPRTPLNVAISGERSFASVECDLAQVKSVARIHSATVNDVILAASAGALRRWLILHDKLPATSLRTAVPFSTREPGNVDHSIQVSFMALDLHTGIDAPQARLRAIHASSLEAKAAAERARALMPGDLPSIGLPWLLGSLARVLGNDAVLSRLPLPFNLIISNVAGPPTPLYVAGARALTYAPVSIPYHGCALNITVYSYDGKLFFGLTGARSALPDLRDLAEGVKLEIDLLTRRRRTARAR
ncbi:MAG: wax ester/triacylglycerol synthase family O-acyltransferase [Pseudomonadota bacterium]|nr:wax ester/triacylglycerol synthase family O-acyltransferase [Pseudomonadota bacterium]MDQ1308925.1 wax ester/triacylglycerol synthase family O-acyltransferase [Pseudomonadota bacterium]